MDIVVTLNSVQQFLDYQTAYFTLECDSNVYRDQVNTTIMDNVSVASLIEDNKEDLYAAILIKKYPNCRIYSANGETLLERVQNWINDGHTNKITGKVIDEIPFEDTHRGSDIPPEVVDRSKIVGSTRILLETASTLEELKQALTEILLGK